MGLRGLVLVGLMAVLSVMAFARPFAGVAAYLIHYHVYPEQSWWGSDLANAGLRYSLTITLCLATGACLNWRSLGYRQLITRQEKLYFCFLAWLVINRLMHGVSLTPDSGVDPIEKMLKMAVFLFILTHVVVTERYFHELTRLLVFCTLYIGYEAYTAPPSAFMQGRLNGSVGGPDFTNSNALAAHCLFLAAISGVYFLRSAEWKNKAMAFLATGLAANAMILTRSRGGFLAALMGLGAALWLAPRGKRTWIAVIVACGLPAIFLLIDTNYLLRMGTIDLDAGQQSEESAQSRLEIWRATFNLIRDNPWGVGSGNFSTRIGEYTIAYANKDTHNTFLRCLAELGWVGFLLFSLLVGNAVWTLFRLLRRTSTHPDLENCCYHCYAFLLACLTYLLAAMFGSYLYLETLWLLLLIPAALERAVANTEESALLSVDDDEAHVPLVEDDCAQDYVDREPVNCG